MQTEHTHDTSNSTTLTIRLDKSIKDKIEIAAKQQQRSKSFLTSSVMADYFALQEWQDARVRKAMVEARQGKGIPHAEVVKWVASLGTKKPLPMPKV
jgi:predicted transcriptional regulator